VSVSPGASGMLNVLLEIKFSSDAIDSVTETLRQIISATIKLIVFLFIYTFP
jgi:hypothetical protein